MSGISIKNLPEKTDTLDENDLMIIEDLEDTKKIPLVRLRAGFSIDSILTSVKQSLQSQIDSFVEKHSQKYQNLLSRNENLEVLCHNLQNDHDHDAERIFELEDRLVIQEELLLDLKEEKNRLIKLLAQLEVDKDALSETIISLSKQISDNDTAIVILKSQVKDLQNKCRDAKETNENLLAQLEELRNSSSITINDHFTEVDTKLTETIDDLMAYIKYYHPNLEEDMNNI